MPEDISKDPIVALTIEYVALQQGEYVRREDASPLDPSDNWSNVYYSPQHSDAIRAKRIGDLLDEIDPAAPQHQLPQMQKVICDARLVYAEALEEDLNRPEDSQLLMCEFP